MPGTRFVTRSAEPPQQGAFVAGAASMSLPRGPGRDDRCEVDPSSRPGRDASPEGAGGEEVRLR